MPCRADAACAAPPLRRPRGAGSARRSRCSRWRPWRAAWYLTHRPAEAPGGAAALRGGPGRRAAAPARRAAGGAGGGAGGGRWRRRGAGAAEHGRRRDRARADLPVVLDALGTVTPVGHGDGAAAGLGRRSRRCCSPKGRWSRRGSCSRPSTRARSRSRCSRRSARACATRRSSRTRACSCSATRRCCSQDSIARQDVDTQARARQAARRRRSSSTAPTRTPRASTSATRRIVAPVAGRVGLRADRRRQPTSAPATPNGVAVITQLAPIDVEFSVPQDRVPEVQARVAAGARLAGRRVRPHAHDEARRGHLLDARQPDRHADRHGASAKARFANAAGALFPNQFVNVRLLLRTIAGAVVVPVTALRHGADRRLRLRAATTTARSTVRAGRARRRDRRRGRRHQGPRASASASSPKAATA